MTEQLSFFNDMPERKAPKAKAVKPQQLDIFGQSELAQFGVVANPRMDISSGKLGMIIEDNRTEEEKEKAIEEEAKKLNGKLF